jgi:hypothetical protein
VQGPQPEAVQRALSQPRLMTKSAPSTLLATTKENFHAETSKLQPDLNRELFLRLLRSVFCPLQYYPVLGLVKSGIATLPSSTSQECLT